jgi:hypothetical protein
MDSTSIFAAVVIVSAGLLLRFFDHLAARRRANKVEAMMLRVIGWRS